MSSKIKKERKLFVNLTNEERKGIQICIFQVREKSVR